MQTCVWTPLPLCLLQVALLLLLLLFLRPCRPDCYYLSRPAVLQETGPITSLTVSEDERGTFLLSNLQNHTVHLWELPDLAGGGGGSEEPDPLENLSKGPTMEYKVNDGKPGRCGPLHAVCTEILDGQEACCVNHLC